MYLGESTHPPGEITYTGVGSHLFVYVYIYLFTYLYACIYMRV